jgi:hypothetical protein
MVEEGIFKREGQVEVWVTNDERKIPVKMRSRVMVGSFSVNMISYSPQ